MRLGERVGLLGARLEFGALLFDELLLMLIEHWLSQKADALQVPLDYVAELGDDRRHELPAGLPVATARVKHSLELINEEGDVAAFSEHGRDDPRQRHDPLEMIEVLRVDEN